jgi:hypothetical protein
MWQPRVKKTASKMTSTNDVLKAFTEGKRLRDIYFVSERFHSQQESLESNDKSLAQTSAEPHHSSDKYKATCHC